LEGGDVAAVADAGAVAVDSADGVSSLPERLDAIRRDMRDEYTQPHKKPWIVGFSGGKDSTLVLQLVLEMVLRLPPSERTRAIHVLSNDTLVESPVVQAFVDRTLDRVRDAMEGLRLPVSVVKTSPDPEHTFWVNLLGRGYPAPSRGFRWCTDRMKIQPTSRHIKSQISAAGEVILLLGVRRSESSNRAVSVARYDNGERLNAHNDLKGCLVYRPIVEMSTDDVWLALMQSRPPWGGSHRELITLYRNAQGGECPFVVDADDAPSCGSSSARFGCWTCTVVDKDKSLQAFVDAGFEHLEPLVEFRNRIKDLSRQPEYRMVERRNGAPGLGPFTIEARRIMLAELREAEAAVKIPLISNAEVRRIEEIWSEDAERGAVRRAERLLKIFEG
jgi:DNA sulfur modification protein DndC